MTNVALSGTATQSSSWSDSFKAEKAIDGNSNSRFGVHMSCTGKADRNPWWLLELEQTYSVQFVRIYNRMDRYSQRLDRLKLTIGADGNTPKYNPYCTRISQVGIRIIDYMCDVGILKGKYVYIYTDEVRPIEMLLTLAEVEVWVLP